jgi:methionyl-tRNA formyltransferase
VRLAFMGTPEFAAVALKAILAAGHDVACIYSQPPRPAGRGMQLRPSPVQALGEERGIDVRTPTSLKSPEEQARFAALNIDCAVVVAYGLLLPKPILEAPTHGCFNIHASLLPRWRGAAPIQRAVMAGDQETGVTIMRMDEGLDTGPMLLTSRCAITEITTASSLHDQLAEIGAAAMLKVLESPSATGTPQPTDGVTYAKKIDKAEAHIAFDQPAQTVLRHIHGLSPFPGAWCDVNGTRLKALRCEVTEGSGTPGTFIDDHLTIACAEGAIHLTSLQREGKGAMDAKTFLRGFPISAGTKAS